MLGEKKALLINQAISEMMLSLLLLHFKNIKTEKKKTISNREIGQGLLWSATKSKGSIHRALK